MNTSPLTICICGGGNLGHTVAGYVAAKKQFSVNLLTSHPERWQREITVKDGNGHTFCGELAVVSNQAELTVPQSDIILLCLPGFAIQDELLKIKPFLKEGQIIGSAGPTTSSRMDKYTPEMLDKGLKGMVGKGKRSPEVIEAMKKNGAVYFAAVGGAGALLSKCIKKADVVAYDDLGTEAIRKLEIENLPVIVVIDKDGNNLYETAKEKWKK